MWDSSHAVKGFCPMVYKFVFANGEFIFGFMGLHCDLAGAYGPSKTDSIAKQFPYISYHDPRVETIIY